MKNLIVCLGYELGKEDCIPLILESRLQECIKLARNNHNSILLLLGGRSFRDVKKVSRTESEVMKEFIIKNAPDIVTFTKIYTEEQTTSTVEQICYLREFVDQHPDIETVAIVSSEFFNERVKLSARYILKPNTIVEFIAAKLPDSLKQGFMVTESVNLKKAQEWLSNHEIGNYKSILQEQLAFQKKIIEGEMDYNKS